MSGAAVKLIFSRGRKELGGASIMIREGVLRTRCKAISVLHVRVPRLRAASGGGMVMAADEIYITIRGKGDMLLPAPDSRYDPSLRTWW